MNFYVFLKLQQKYLPKVYKKLIEHHFIPTMYASQWFITLFVIVFPIEAVIRIWDIYFVEGRKILYRVGLAILKYYEKTILEAELEDLLELFKTVKFKTDIDELIRLSFGFGFSKG